MSHHRRLRSLLPTSRLLVLSRQVGRAAASAAASPSPLAPPRPRHASTCRGKKTKTRFVLSDPAPLLPQGALPPLPRPPRATATADESEAGAPQYPTVIQQARRHMHRFSGCVLLTRVGGFYELYFGQAEELGPLLNLKVASKKTSAGPVPMAGFPFVHLDRYLKVLVQDLSRYVAVAEEFPNSAPEQIRSGGLRNDRRVVRIITPGTLIDENFMDPFANNYVMAIFPVGQAHDWPLETPSPLPEAAPVLSAAPTPAPPAPPAPAPALGPPATAPSPSLPLGLAWLDLSTGQFFTQPTPLSSLSSILASVGPREVVLDPAFRSRPDHGVFAVLSEDRHLITYPPPPAAADDGHDSGSAPPRTVDDWTPMLESEVASSTRDSLSAAEVSAANLLLGYVKDRLRGLTVRLQPPQRRDNMHIMALDKNTMRSLEIRQTIRDGMFRGSLLHAIRRTVTKSGARLLSEWLSSPSTSLEVIRARQDLVARFIADEGLRDSVSVLLGRVHDSQRLVQKFSLGRGDPDDLLALAQTIRAAAQIVSLLEGSSAAVPGLADDGSSLRSLLDRMQLDEPLRLADQISHAIDEQGILQQHEKQADEMAQMMELGDEAVSAEEPSGSHASVPAPAVAVAGRKRLRPITLREYYSSGSSSSSSTDDGSDYYWIMRPDASPALQRLHAEIAAGQDEKLRLAQTLRDRFDAKSLTLRWAPSVGHICHVRGKDTSGSFGDGARSISASRSTRSFHLPEWTALGQRLDHTRFRIHDEEQRVLQRLREQVVAGLVGLRRNAAVLDELDVVTSFSRLAVERGLTRPVLDGSACHKIIGGRHPTVEGGLQEQGRSFVRNDCLVGAPGHGRIWIITGPNMAGKSTFLRQNALITILAQVGCYVPADYAEIGIVDAMFSRVGSADNLYRNQSTFMVEMLETAQILRTATARSFVIMDEVGRGTTPHDGSAVAFASLRHLVTINKSRTLFATHFHAVADLVVKQGLDVSAGGAIEMYCTDVEEDDQGGFCYVHKLRRGVNRESHALKVARLAGLPESAIQMAQRALEDMCPPDTAEGMGSDAAATVPC